jgi:hypothetical protein
MMTIRFWVLLPPRPSAAASYALRVPRARDFPTGMRVKVAAKVLVIAWTLMKKKELFDPVYLKAEIEGRRVPKIRTVS